MKENKKLIVYFSYTGNTKKIAEKVCKEVKADMVEIETVIPYGENYNQVVQQGKEEVERGFKPKIKKLKVDLAQYDIIILGTPVWWYTMAPAVFTFLTDNNLTDKVIIPFATNGGWIGHTFEDIKKACPRSEMREGLDLSLIHI